VADRYIQSYLQYRLYTPFSVTVTNAMPASSQFTAGDLILLRRSDGVLRYGEVIAATGEYLEVLDKRKINV
jgi:hypothetical protein